jgi:phosphohistidine phosphatase SixA
VGVLRDHAAAEHLRLMQAAKRDILRALGEAGGYKAWHLGNVLSAIDAAIQSSKSRAQGPVARAVMDAAGLAESSVARGSLYGVSTNLTSSIIDVTTDQVRAVWTDLGSHLKVLVRRATLGITDPAEAITKLMGIFNREDTWRSSEWDAERIIRNEVGRTFEMASNAVAQAAKESGQDVRKWWLATDDGRTRPEHLEAWRRYRPGGTEGPIPVDEPFIVGGVELMFPGDPQAQGDPRQVARMTILCRCTSITEMEE